MFSTETLAPVEIGEYELERGKPMPSLKYGRIQRNLLRAAEQCLGLTHEAVPKLKILLAERTAVPDIAIFGQGDLPDTQHGPDYIVTTVVPQTATEILAPTQVLADLLEKSRRYFAAGVRSYWLVLSELRGIAV